MTDQTERPTMSEASRLWRVSGTRFGLKASAYVRADTEYEAMEKGRYVAELDDVESAVDMTDTARSNQWRPE